MIEYRQKSKLFLFPLLGIPNTSAFKPTNTYLASPSLGIDVEDYKLVVCYDKNHAEYNENLYGSFESKMLLGHKQFLELVVLEDCLLYVFDMSKFKKDFDCVVTGKYSMMSEKCRLHIDRYHESKIGPNRYIRYSLFPDDKAYAFYAKELNVDEEDLRKGVELCSPADIERETLIKKDIDLFV